MSEIHDKIIEYFKTKDNPIILDLGTYLLEDVSIFADRFPLSQCFAFEADPRNHLMNIKSNEYNNIQLIGGAIGDIDGEVDFYPSEKIDWTRNWNLSGSIRQPKDHLTEYTVSFGKPFKIFCQKLDTWYKKSEIYNQPIELIYSDLNGAEGDMILGGTEILQKTHLLYLEVFEKELYAGMKDQSWIHNELTQLGFEYLLEFGHNRLYQNKNL